MKTSVFMTS